MAYKDEIAKIIEKAMKDELSSAVFYLRQAEEITGYDDEEVSAKLRENGKEEFEHFSELMAFAGKFGLINNIKINFEDFSLDMMSTDTDNIVVNIEKLEREAYDDYKAAAKLAHDNDDFETHDFFKHLMTDESAHLDNFLLFQDKTRVIGESKKLKKTSGMSLKDFLK